MSRRPAWGTVSGTVLATLLVVALIVAGVLAWDGSRRFTTEPVETAAPATVTAAVRKGSVAQTVAGQAVVATDPGRGVNVPDSVAAAGAVVTRDSARAGASLALGTRIAVVGERPIFLLKGAVPMFRRLALATRGPDVQAAQSSLLALGYGLGDDEGGVVGPGTLAAFQSLYRDNGSTLVTADGARPGRTTKIAALTVPQGELFFTPAGTARTLDDCGPIGRKIEAGAPVCRVAGARTTLRLSIPLAAASQVKEGMVVAVDGMPATAKLFVGAAVAAPTTAGSAKPTDADAAPTAAQDSADEGKLFEVSGAPAALPNGVDGAAGTVTTAATTGALIVPVTAVLDTPGGKSVRVAKGESRRDVKVRLGLCASGECAVTPAGGALAVGDEVVVYQGQ